jgi:hypothetical protein
MGLGISRSIIESHGGRLWGVSPSGHVATFRFTLSAAMENQRKVKTIEQSAWIGIAKSGEVKLAFIPRISR